MYQKGLEIDGWPCLSSAPMLSLSVSLMKINIIKESQVLAETYDCLLFLGLNQLGVSLFIYLFVCYMKSRNKQPVVGSAK